MKKFVSIIATCLILSSAALPASKESKAPKGPNGPVPVAVFGGGGRLEFLRAISSEQQLHEKRGFWNKLVDLAVGAPTWHRMVRPYAVTTDSRGRLLITDPGAHAVHIFDLEKKKYSFIEGGKKDSFDSPIGIAVDDVDNIYVTDSQRGKVFVFDSGGKFRRMIGDIKGEGFFKRPTGIAFDKATRHLFITDTLRDRVFITDLNGSVLKYFGGRGAEPGQFNFPTEVVVHGEDVFVVDAMNFRVQMFDNSGGYRGQFGSIGMKQGQMFRPKGLGVDTDGNIYLVDAAMEAVQVFNREGKLLYTFGNTGGGISQFELPSGIRVDERDRIYVADSYNHRVQVFQYVRPGEQPGGGPR